MPTYLMTWNSRDALAWPQMSRDAEVVASGGKPQMWWRCGHSKTIHKGDSLLLFRQGTDPKGVIGTAVAISDWEAYESGGPKQPSRTKNRVHIQIESLVNPDIDDLLTVSQMTAGGVAGVKWNVQESGTRIPDDDAKRIVELWLPKSTVILDSADLAGIEGELRLHLVRHRKRERRLRDAVIAAALKKYGALVCEVPRCNFDFLVRYGELGRAFAHVHHIAKLADRTHPMETRVSELKIVCANCHAMIHRGNENRDMDTLIPILRR